MLNIVMVMMSPDTRINEAGLEAYPKEPMVIGNLVMVLWFILGAVACWFFSPFLGVAYFIAAVLLIYVLLRKMVCPNCYYYDKWCSLGWGKLTAKMFKKGTIDDFPKSIGLKLVPAVYGALMIVPMIILVVSLIQGFSWYKIVVLVLLLLVSFYSGGIGRRSACSHCKMNVICPGSVAK